MINIRTIYLAIVTVSAVVCFIVAEPDLPTPQELAEHIESGGLLEYVAVTLAVELVRYPPNTIFHPNYENGVGEAATASLLHTRIHTMPEKLRTRGITDVGPALKSAMELAKLWESRFRFTRAQYHANRTIEFESYVKHLKQKGRGLEGPLKGGYDALIQSAQRMYLANVVAREQRHDVNLRTFIESSLAAIDAEVQFLHTLRSWQEHGIAVGAMRQRGD